MVRVYAHVATFGSMLLISCGATYAFSYTYGKSEDSKLSELDEKFKEQRRLNNEKRKAMETFFQQMKDKNENPTEQDDRFSGT